MKKRVLSESGNMALNQSTKIVTDGLIFCYDMPNGKSFVGAPVTNTLPTPAVNGLPTFGNGWATYNTNQYNGNAYFSIGSISSVAGNIVTTSGNHPLRSYDVVTPQTTGGGVTAGTNYLVKKLSNTTFSLHPWNGSQDGSQGFINPATGNHKVYDDFANDVRISINATSFPTMWWGPPHLANSALVKEIIPNGFTGIPGRLPTDCVRLHFNRTDATDGMAYGPEGAVTAGVLHTVSFWARSVTASAVGTTGSYQIYNYGATTPTGYSIGYTLGPVGVWQKYILQFTPNNPLAISYWFPGTGGIKYDIANIQFEVGSVANNFAPGIRSNTQSILDLTNRSTNTTNNLSYNSDGTFNFIGGDATSTITVPLSTAFNKLTGTIGMWVNPSSYSGGNGLFVNRENNIANAVDWFWIGSWDSANVFYFRLGNGSDCCSNDLTLSSWASFCPTNTWTYVTCSWQSGGLSRIYTNGILRASRSISAIPATNPSATGRIGLGHEAPGSWNGRIAVAQIYNRQLTDSEILSNFNSMRGRFNV